MCANGVESLPTHNFVSRDSQCWLLTLASLLPRFVFFFLLHDAPRLLVLLPLHFLDLIQAAPSTLFTLLRPKLSQSTHTRVCRSQEGFDVELAPRAHTEAAPAAPAPRISDPWREPSCLAVPRGADAACDAPANLRECVGSFASKVSKPR